MNGLSKEEKKLRLRPIEENFSFFAKISVLFGMIYPFCLYRNPFGVTYPLFVLFSCICFLAACQKLSVPIKKGSWFLLAVAMLLGISTFLTADPFLHFFNKLALILLGAVLALHQFYNDKSWNIGKYSVAIFLYFWHSLIALPWPLVHALHHRKEGGARNWQLLLLPAAGLMVAFPVCLLLILILCQADAVFSSMMWWFLKHAFSPFALVHITVMLVFGIFAPYCLICSCCLRKIPETTPNRQALPPAMAEAFIGAIGFVYLLFCAVQIFYLFLGKGSLPEGYTYSSYARRGFFQLLLVAFFNLALVLCCLKYVRPRTCLRLLLTLVTACTYVLIASAAYRMALYVNEYHLSYLRILVLWFLALLFVLMLGVARIIWKPEFPLFWFFVATVSVFYVSLSLARPDAIIARSYVARLDPATATESQFRYLTEGLCADAAPAVATLGLDLEELRQRSGNHTGKGWAWRISRQPGRSRLNPRAYPDGVRSYNYSVETARRLFGQ